MKFSEYLNEIIGKLGLGKLADLAMIDPSALSRFRSGQGALPINAIETLLMADRAIIIPCGELRKREEALDLISELWRTERKKCIELQGTRKEEPASRG